MYGRHGRNCLDVAKKDVICNNNRFVLYVQEVVNLQKKIFNIFASENEVYTIY